jgi:hypothetical protein
MTDIVTVTQGGGSGPVGAGFRTAPLYGSVSPTVTSNGYSYAGIYDVASICTPRGTCSNGSANFVISGLSADPGKTWLTAIAAFNVTLAGASASSYGFSNGTATWYWSGKQWGFTGSGTTTVQVTHGAPPIGYLDLKFVIVAVDYAPPGSASSVTYSNSTVRGTAASDSHTYKTTVDLSFAGDIGANFFGVAEGGITGTTDIGYQQTTGNNGSVTITNMNSNTDIVRGPSSSALGVDHDYDVIWVWLNPVSSVYVGNNTVTFAGYDFNAEDDMAEAEIVPLEVRQLKNPSLFSSGTLQRLARTWDTSGLGGLNSADYAKILAADPFANSTTYNPNTDTSHRFQEVSGSTIPYVPPAPGGQPVTAQGMIETQTATSASKNATYQYSVGFSLVFSSAIDFLAEFTQKITVSGSYTETDMWSKTNNATVGKAANYSVTGPQSSDHYTGPVSFQVFRDNVYGSFMFYPLTN